MPVGLTEPSDDFTYARPPQWLQPNRRCGIHPGRVGDAVYAAGLGPEPPFTHTPRLHEHDAAAQVNTGTFRMNWVPANDNPPHLHRRRPPLSGPISVGHP